MIEEIRPNFNPWFLKNSSGCWPQVPSVSKRIQGVHSWTFFAVSLVKKYFNYNKSLITFIRGNWSTFFGVEIRIQFFIELFSHLISRRPTFLSIDSIAYFKIVTLIESEVTSSFRPDVERGQVTFSDRTEVITEVKIVF